jgi:spoIIIJ-associated protein
MTQEDQLNTEAELAADYIEELLDIADIGGDLELGVKNGRAFIEISAEDKEELNLLVGDNGEVVNALQELARLNIKSQTGDFSNLILDINKWREEKNAELVEEATKAVAEVLENGEDLELRPMNAFERKLVHDKVKELGAFSHSKGERKNRHVVITKEDNTPEETTNEEAPAEEAAPATDGE